MAQWLLFGPVQRSVVAAIRVRVPPSGAVLDIGCGTGRLLDRLAGALPHATLVGVDRSWGMTGAARRARPSLRFERGDAEVLPHPDASFDAIVTTLSFHHWSDKRAALAEVMRVLRPGGIFALADASVDDLPSSPRWLWSPAQGRMDDMPSLLDRDRLLETAGFEVLEVVPTLRRRWVALTLAGRPAS